MPTTGVDRGGTRSSSGRVLFACASLSLVTFGIVLTTLGAILPSVMERFGIDKAAAGALLFVMTFGILCGALVSGPMLDRYGYKSILLVGTALIVAALQGVAFAPSIGWLRASAFVAGLGGGAINSGANTLVSDTSGERRGAQLNVLAVFFGVGASGVPLLLAILTGRFPDSALIAGVGALVIVPCAVIAMTSFPPPKQAQGFPLAAAGRLVRDPLMLLMGLILFLQSGIEITVGGWTSTFVEEELVTAERSGLVLLSLYWAGMMVGRLTIGTVLSDVPPFRVLYASLTIALSGTAVLLGAHGAGRAALAVVLLGVGFAAMFPTVLGFIGSRYEGLSGTAFGAALAMALTGGMLLPYATGLLGHEFGMRRSFLIVPTSLVLLGALLFVLRRGLRQARD